MNLCQDTVVLPLTSAKSLIQLLPPFNEQNKLRVMQGDDLKCLIM